MIIDELFEAPQLCPECGGISFSDLILAEKKDACYYKVKASAKVWPSAYASGRLVQCRKKGAANYGNKSESVAEGSRYKCTCHPGDADPDCPVHGLEPMEVGDALDVKKGVAEQQELDEKWSQKYKSSINCANPKGFSQKAHCAGRKKNEDVAEAGPSKRDPLDYPPLEGPGGSGAGGYTGGPSPFRGIFGRSKETPVTEPKWSTTKIPGVDVHTGPPPTVVTKPSNINKQIDPASDVPAYIRKGLPDPVTVPKPGTKPSITIKPGETMDQAMQRTKAEQEFGRFLQGQSGQTFGTPGAGRGGQGGPTAAQATSGSNQVPTIKLPNGQTIPDPARVSPSGQYNTQSGSSPEPAKTSKQVFPEPWMSERNREFVEFKRKNGYEHPDKYDFDLDVMAARHRTGQDMRGSPGGLPTGKKSQYELDQDAKKRGAWKTPDTDIELEETSRKKREQPEANYDDEYDAMVARVKKLAGLGPMKTVYDPTKRVYRNMPTAVQPKK